MGQPILHNDYNELSFKESATFFGLCLLVQMVLLFWLGKGVRGVIGPISVVVLSVIWTLGMIQVLGFTLNLFIILIPTLLICVCIGDSMHISTAGEGSVSSRPCGRPCPRRVCRACSPA